MKSFHLKLLIGLLAFFGLVLLGMALYEPLWWKWYEFDLINGDEESADRAAEIMATKKDDAIEKIREWIASGDEKHSRAASRVFFKIHSEIRENLEKPNPFEINSKIHENELSFLGFTDPAKIQVNEFECLGGIMFYRGKSPVFQIIELICFKENLEYGIEPVNQIPGMVLHERGKRTDLVRYYPDGNVLLEQTKQIQRKLKNRITLKFANASLFNVINFLGDIAQINYVISDKAFEVTEEDLVTFNLKNAPLKNVLNKIEWRFSNKIVLKFYGSTMVVCSAKEKLPFSK